MLDEIAEHAATVLRGAVQCQVGALQQDIGIGAVARADRDADADARGVSDLARGGAVDKRMLTFMGLAAGNSAHLVRAFVGAMD